MDWSDFGFISLWGDGFPISSGIHSFHQRLPPSSCSFLRNYCEIQTLIVLIMPVLTTYPGVYIEEISSGVHTITGVATSITAFIGYTQRGLDHRATQIFSFADFERTFGGLAADSELSYAEQQFFANGGSNAYVVRVPQHSSTAAKVTLLDSGNKEAVTLTALSNGTWSDH